MKLQSRSAQLLNFLAVLLAIFVGAQKEFAQTVSTRITPKVIEFSGELRIGREVTLTVANLSDWAINNDPQKLVPYLNGRALKNVYPEQIDLSSNKLRFHLRASEVSQEAWSDLLHEPTFYRPVAVSVGLEDQSPFDTIFNYDNPLNLTVIPKLFGIISLLLILVSTSLFLFLLRTTDIIREPCPKQSQGKSKRFSLSRALTAFWFFLVSIAYVCLWLITGDFNTLTPSVLALIGINAVSTVTTQLMRGKHNVSQCESSIFQRGNLSVGVASKGFFSDVLSGPNGYSFHRFQMVAWTLVFGVIFIYTVYHNLAMPNFNMAMLGLMGISALTFIGFESVQIKSSPKTGYNRSMNLSLVSGY